MLKSRSIIWNYGSTRDPNVGTIFHHRMSAASAEPKVGSNQRKIFNSVVCILKIYQIKVKTYKVKQTQKKHKIKH